MKVVVFGLRFVVVEGGLVFVRFIVEDMR